MKHAIKKHLRDFVAIIVLFVIGAGRRRATSRRTSGSTCRPGCPASAPTSTRSRPSSRPRRRSSPARARPWTSPAFPVGEIGKVDLREGVAVVQHEDPQEVRARLPRRVAAAAAEDRPEGHDHRDGPRHAAGRGVQGGRDGSRSRRPRRTSTSDEILAALDADTRSYLTVLITAGGEVFKQPGYSGGPARDASSASSRPARDVEKITSELGKRRRNTQARRSTTSGCSTEELGDKDTQLAEFVDSSNANFQALANAGPEPARGAARAAADAPAGRDDAGQDRRRWPTSSARRWRRCGRSRATLGPTLRQTRPFLRQTTPIIRDQLRPFAREARPAVRELRTTASQLQPITPRLTRTLRGRQLAAQHVRVQPARAPRRATCSGPPG